MAMPTNSGAIAAVPVGTPNFDLDDKLKRLIERPSTLKVLTPETRALIEKIKADLKKRAEQRPSSCG
jgi:hypothetical protein